MLGVLVVGFAASVSALAGLAPLETVEVNGKTILANDKGMTAYVFDKDTAGSSTCYAECESAWPPILLQAGQSVSSPLGTTKRQDGTEQITYQGRREIGNPALGKVTIPARFSSFQGLRKPPANAISTTRTKRS